MRMPALAGMLAVLVLLLPAVEGYNWDFELDNRPNPVTNRPQNVFQLGALGKISYENLYKQWGPTFQEYLTETVGLKYNVSFNLTYLDFDETYDKVERKEIDMVFTNPSAYACLEREYGAVPIVSLRNKRNGVEMDHFYGTFIVRNDSSITKISEIEGKIVEAVSLVGLGACQLQWDELLRRGIQFMSAPKQVIFSGGQGAIIKDVMAGKVDIGMIRTDEAESWVDQGTKIKAPDPNSGELVERPLEATDLRVLEDLRNDPSGPEPNFPFPYSTRLAAPEWPLAYLSDVVDAVENGSGERIGWVIMRAVAEELMKINPDMQPAVAGKYATWVPPMSYNGMHVMQGNLGWIDSQGKCQRNSDLCSSVVCPEGQVRKSCEQIENGCTEIGLECPYTTKTGHKNCLCRPCAEVPPQEVQVRALRRLSDQYDETFDLQTNGLFPECQKMVSCTNLEQADVLELEVEDMWYSIRGALGYAKVAKMQYNWAGAPNWQDLEFSATSDATQTVKLAATKEGSLLLQVRRCLEGEACETIDQSPLLVTVGPKQCLDESKMPDEVGKCICREVFETLADGSCAARGGTKDNTVLIVVLVLVVAMVVLAVGAFLYLKRARQDDSWKISMEEVIFDSPAVVLGRGTFGQVLKAQFRGTDVAVKRVLPKFKPPKAAMRSLENEEVLHMSQMFKKESSIMGGKAPGRSYFVDVAISEDDFIKTRQRSSIKDSAEAAIDDEKKTSRSSVPFDSASTEGGQSSSRHSSGGGLMDESHDRPFSERKKARQSVVGLHRKHANDLELREHCSSDSSTKSTGRNLSGSTSASNTANTGMSAGMTGMTGGGISLQTFKKLNREFIKEMQVMVFLRHPNIVTVMGAVVENNMEPLMVMENMRHGSLFDLVHNGTMQFDASIVSTILSNIVSGMCYLHSTNPPVLHNDLKTGNVLVAENFQAKIADFGLSMKKKSSGYLGTPFWMAPELLTMNTKPSVKSDMYSFAITMFEIFTRKEPYSEYEDAMYVLDRLRDNSEGDEVLRPTIPEGFPADVKATMTKCWAQDPAHRPSFEAIREEMTKWDNDGIDKWFNSMDGGAHCRSSRTDAQLLFDVFPSHIAKTLKEGRKVEPEHHDCVTIFFSDIVGFTDISRQLKPIEVMNMLDRLYEQFDRLAREHDIFKVETIGDAYMAVANLVKKQPNHTQLIAQFALAATKMANTCIVHPDRPELGYVNIRVGFHSGPVVSSVVGSMNPRFCLFGDTVNTASRMESNSEKNRIHMSDSAAELLKVMAPHMNIECRGEIPIKGKGTMTTYWVNEGTAAAQTNTASSDEVAIQIA